MTHLLLLLVTAFPVQAQTWEATDSMVESRPRGDASLLQDGRVLATGGWEAERDMLAEVWDPATETWSSVGSIFQRYLFEQATLGDGTVLIPGGWGGGNGECCFDNAHLYDPATNTFTLIFGMRSRGNFTATLLKDGRLLLAAGISTSEDPFTSATADLYDPATRTFSPTGDLITRRADHAAVRLADGRVLVTGGNTDFSVTISSAEIYNPATGTWSPTAPMSTPREHHTASLLPDGRVLVAGGYVNQGGTAVRMSTTEIYDPASGTWSPGPSMSAARAEHEATTLADGSILVSGGGVASAEIYDPDTGTWSSGGAMEEARVGHFAVRLLDGRVLAGGGSSALNSNAVGMSAEVFTPGTGVGGGPCPCPPDPCAGKDHCPGKPKPDPEPHQEAQAGDERAYPNPWRGDQHGTAPMKFDQLPAGAVIRIFTLSGRFVRELSSSGGTSLWDLKNDSGDGIGSGFYRYVIESPEGRSTGKIAIIR